MQNVVYIKKKKNWSLFNLVRRRFLICFYLFFVLFVNFFAIVSFVTTTLDQSQFQNHVRPSQINVNVPIRLKFKLYAVFAEWDSRADFLFSARQDIVNFSDFRSNVSRNCNRSLLPKITRLYWWEMFVKMSLLDRLVHFVDFVGMILLALVFLLTLTKCFLRFCFPTLFAAGFQSSLALSTSAFSGTASCNKSALARLVAGTKKLRNKGITVLRITCGSPPNPILRCQRLTL